MNYTRTYIYLFIHLFIYYLFIYFYLHIHLYYGCEPLAMDAPASSQRPEDAIMDLQVGMGAAIGFQVIRPLLDN